MKEYTSVVECIAGHASTHPDRLAIADSKTSYTYSQAWHKIIAVASYLKNLGIRKDSRVVVECSQTADYIIAEMAIQLLGAVFVPVEKNAALNRITEIIEETQAHIHIGKKPVHTNSCRTEFVKMSDISNIPSEDSPYAVYCIRFPGKNDIAEILFSTGTTGKSKGIVLTHRNDIAIAENVICGVEMKPKNIELIPMPLSHSHGLRRTYANLVNGSTAIFSDGITLLKSVFNLIEDYHVTSLDLSPSMLSIIFKLSKNRLADYKDSLDYIQLGSAPLPEDSKIHLKEILPNTRLYNFYGSTEAGCSCLLDFNSMSGKPGCIGKPAKNAKFIVVDNDRNEIKSSKEHPGFLASCGPINMKCYFRAPSLTKEATNNGSDYIYTKDLGYIDDEGYIYMLGRKDDVINYGGIKIAPEEIESIAIKHEGILDCAVVPISDPLTGQAPELFVSLEDEKEYNPKEFKNFLKTNLDANKQPKFIKIIDKIPRTFNGKIKRKELINHALTKKH